MLQPYLTRNLVISYKRNETNHPFSISLVPQHNTSMPETWVFRNIERIFKTEWYFELQKHYGLRGLDIDTAVAGTLIMKDYITGEEEREGIMFYSLDQRYYAAMLFTRLKVRQSDSSIYRVKFTCTLHHNSIEGFVDR